MLALSACLGIRLDVLIRIRLICFSLGVGKLLPCQNDVQFGRLDGLCR